MHLPPAVGVSTPSVRKIMQVSRFSHKPNRKTHLPQVEMISTGSVQLKYHCNPNTSHCTHQYLNGEEKGSSIG
jgi:hypothetical protein